MTDTWRYIDTGMSSATYNMAIDEAIGHTVRKNHAPPTLRLYGWNSQSVTIGCFQNLNGIDIEYCTEQQIPIVRRLTGGRAILHGDEVTYSLSVRTKTGLFSKGLLDSYRKISMAIVNALSLIGITSKFTFLRKNCSSSHAYTTQQLRRPLCFNSISYGEITIQNKKVLGSAQKRWADGLLQQGCIPLLIDRNEMMRVFRLNSYYDINTMIGLKEIFPEFNPHGFKEALRTSFEETFNIKLVGSLPTQEEVAHARELEALKYRSPEWNFIGKSDKEVLLI